MTATALKALKASIEHWKRLATGKRKQDEDIGVSHCALCLEFITTYCRDCPVKKKTGLWYCEGTPYHEVNDVREHEVYDLGKHGLNSKPFKRAAKKELKFLQSLLPKRRKK